MEQRYRDHWPEYLMEAGGLGLFMISACVFTTMLEHPGSPIRQWLGSAFLRRTIIGVGMGLTAIGLIYSPWGKQSGAHLNPSVTITFFRLGKLARADALFYVLAQFAGASAGVFASSLLLSRWISNPAVNYAVTVPGAAGTAIAFGAELLISFLLMTIILFVSNSKTLPAFTGVIAGILVATYITLESPLSGMSMNPARTLGSAALSHTWKAWWIYFTAPPIGMLAAGELYLRLRGARGILCAKLHHQNDKRCIFHCGFRERSAPVPEASAASRPELSRVECSTGVQHSENCQGIS
jgi:aquaporin Z